MYQAFGWEPPVFCHLPMVMGSDGQKLSKRHGATSINEFRTNGYLPKAIVNYIAMVGASYEDGRDLYPLADLEKLFKIEHLNKAPAVFDYKKLEWFNGQYMRLYSDDELYNAVLPFLPPELKRDDARPTLMRVMPLIKERLHFLNEAPDMVRFLFTEPAVPSIEALIPKKLDATKTVKVLEAAVIFVKAIASLDHEAAEQLARETAEKLGIKLGDFMMPIRLAVTGSNVSPPLIGSIAALGYDKAVERIKRTLMHF
jgi:glutamyl-tRNA synthetase